MFRPTDNSPGSTICLTLLFVVLCFISALVSLEVSAQDQVAAVNRYFHIKVIDEQTGRGVPLVELRTVNQLRYYTDSNGSIALFEPELMNEPVYFHVSAHGYEYPKDGFGFRGIRLTPASGELVTIKLKRINIAERLYRLTGAGIYRDSHLLGEEAPIERPLLNGKVFGSDSVVNAIYRDKIYWFWGDTNRPDYPLGLFHVPQATSSLPATISVSDGIDLNYVVGETGFVKAACQMPGEGPTWIFGLMVASHEAGDGTERLEPTEKMLAMYMKTKGDLKVYQRGMVEYDDESQSFRKLKEFPAESPLFPDGQTVKYHPNGAAHFYFATPYPFVRVKADYASATDLKNYEAYTCFTTGSRIDDYKIDRAKDGTPIFKWRRDTLPLTESLQKKLFDAGKLEEAGSLFNMRDVDSDNRITLASGSVCWNEYRKKWIMIAVERFGTASVLGEVWYAEADTITGPWRSAKKIISHDRYSFYNPKQHPYFDQDGGRFIHFEGTYTAMFSGNEDKTPRYDYNQIMYRLDLADPRLKLDKND